MRFILMMRDIPVLEYRADKGKIMALDKILCKERLTLCMINDSDEQKLQSWLEHRRIPKSRIRYHEMNSIFKEKCGKNIPELVEYNYGLNLSDQYWIKPDKEDVSWEQINFYENPFSYDTGNIFFDSEKINTENKFISPDFSTNGVAIKTWRIKNNKRYLIKAGQKAKMQEPINEVAVSMYLQSMNFPYLTPAIYTLSVIHGKLCCISENFLSEHIELVTAYDVYNYHERKDGETMYSHMVKMCRELQIPDAEKFMDALFVFDSLISNTDRHLGNFGFLRDTKTMKFIGPAPLYDNGSSLWADEILINDNPCITDDIAKPFCKLHSDLIKDLHNFDFIKRYNPDLLKQIFREAAHGHIDEQQICFITNKIEKRYREVVKEIEKIREKDRNREEELER